MQFIPARQVWGPWLKVPDLTICVEACVVSPLVVEEVLVKRRISTDDVPMRQALGRINCCERWEAASDVQQSYVITEADPRTMGQILVDPFVTLFKGDRQYHPSPGARKNAG